MGHASTSRSGKLKHLGSMHRVQVDMWIDAYVPEQGGAENAGRFPVLSLTTHYEGGAGFLQKELEWSHVSDDAVKALEPHATTAANDVFRSFISAWPCQCCSRTWIP